MQPIDKLKILTIGVKAVFIALFFLLILAFLSVTLYSYDEFTGWIMSTYEKMDKLELFRLRYLTKERYTCVRIATGLVVLACLAALFRLQKISELISSHLMAWNQSFADFYRYLIEPYVVLSRVQKMIFWLMIIVMITLRWIFMHRYYFQNDELFSYLFFVRKGLFVLTSYYPGPNNHVFYSFLAYLTQFFSSNPFYTMKIPSFIAGSLTPVFLFFFLKRYYSFSISIIGILLFSCSVHFFYYSLFGRGYVLMTFFSVFGFFMVLEIMDGKMDRFIWHVYVLTSILGFFTLPSYLYPFVSFAVAIGIIIVMKQRFDHLKPFLYYHVIITVIVLVLYSPIALVSGVASLTSNPWVARMESKEFFLRFPDMIGDMFGYLTNMEEGAIWFSMILFSLVGYIFIKTKKLNLGIVITSLFIIPVIMLLIQRVNPFDRVWTYLILPYSICLLVTIEHALKFIQKYKLMDGICSVLICLGMIGYTVYYFYKDTNHGHMIYDEVSRISSYVAKESNGNIYTNEDLYNLYIRYESSRAGNEIIPDMTANKKIQEYSHVLLVPGTSFPEFIRKEDYLLKEQNPYIEVYKLKQ